MVQLREKDLPTRELLALAVALRETIGDRASLTINGRADVAFAASADGVHLPADGLPTDGARAALGRSFIIGRSVHRVDEAERAATEDVDYLELGTIFPSRSHPGGPVLGLGVLRSLTSVSLPILAIGGIDAANAGAVIAAGAGGVAVISTILRAPEPGNAARALADTVHEAWSRRSRASGADG